MRRRTAFKVAARAEQLGYMLLPYKWTTVAKARKICQRLEFVDPRAPYVESDSRLESNFEMRCWIFDSFLERIGDKLGTACCVGAGMGEFST